MNSKKFIEKNIVLISVFIFIMLFLLVQTTKPGCFFREEGSIREFGIGYKNKTIFPLWLFSITLGILIFICMHYYIKYC